MTIPVRRGALSLRQRLVYIQHETREWNRRGGGGTAEWDRACTHICLACQDDHRRFEGGWFCLPRVCPAVGAGAGIRNRGIPSVAAHTWSRKQRTPILSDGAIRHRHEVSSGDATALVFSDSWQARR